LIYSTIPVSFALKERKPLHSHRQESLLKQLKNAESKQQAASIITELLIGQV